MNTTLYRALVIPLALVGLADAIYLTEMALTGSQLSCDISGLDGCNVVAQSVYSKVFGLPLAAYGVMFFSLFLCAFLFGMYRAGRGIERGVFLISLAGALFSTYFLYLQIAVIQALCIYCIVSAFVAYTLTLLTWRRLYKEDISSTIAG